MDYVFQLSAPHRIIGANYNTFVNPILHPNRIMPEHDFLYILDGTWEIALESADSCELFQVQRGDLIILPAKLHHYGTKLCSPNSKNMFIHVTPVLGDDLFSKRKEYDSKISKDYVLLSTITHCNNNLKINHFFSDIIATYWGNSNYKEKKMTCLFELLLCEIQEQQLKSPATFQFIAFVEEVAQFLQANPQTFFSVPDIAAKFQISVGTLNNRFKRVYGKTFYTWQMDQKLEMVYQFLRSNPDITFRETALNFGFYDEFHLSRAFKKYFGTAPKYIR